MLVRVSRLPLFVLLLALTLPAPLRAWAADAGAKPAPATAASVAPAPAGTTATTAPAKPAKPAKASKKAKAPKNPPVTLFTVNHKETFSLRLRDAQGKPIKGNQRRFDRFLRCHHTEAKHSMNPRLMRLLYQTGRHWPGKRLEVVSGYRSPKVAKNPHSPHMKGLACDFRVEGVTTTELRDYLRKAFEKVGVGYYPNSTFVHLDVRKEKSAFWIDYSGPGERAVYSENPSEDLKTGRADSYHPTKIDESWASDETSVPGGADGKGAPPAAPQKDEAHAGETPKP
ncbi:MAG TPA: DUF882 domain-containing protein [Polyangia bacterium]|jgi:uncharacterized protein YcbK (DUF882 family)|nr:DUF882 domain-containing protein [Polyangia bacterium]